MRKGASANARKRLALRGAVMLTSMMDILTVMLFFLLQNFSYTQTNFAAAKDVVLPASTTQQPPPDSPLQLVVSKNAVILDEVELAPIVNGDIPREYLYRDGVTIVRLAQALQQHKKRSKYIESRSDTHSFTGTIVLQADKEHQFKLLKKVIYTAGVTDFVMLKLATMREPQ